MCVIKILFNIQTHSPYLHIPSDPFEWPLLRIIALEQIIKQSGFLMQVQNLVLYRSMQTLFIKCKTNVVIKLTVWMQHYYVNTIPGSYHTL